MIKAIIFDLDGTLWNGEIVIKGAVDTIAVLKNLGYQMFFLTNNSGKTQKQIIDKLKSFGFPAESQNTYCGSYAMATYLAENKILSVYVVGAKGLKKDLRSYDIRVEEFSDVSAVVVGLDPTLSYHKIAMASDAIRNGAKLIVSNLDRFYPIENNQRLPGCGAMVGAIVGATGYKPDFQVGKPNTYMLELICKEHKLSAKEICLVGDELENDIKMARNFGCESILFDPKITFSSFTGKKTRELCKIISILKGGYLK